MEGSKQEKAKVEQNKAAKLQELFHTSNGSRKLGVGGGGREVKSSPAWIAEGVTAGKATSQPQSTLQHEDPHQFQH